MKYLIGVIRLLILIVFIIIWIVRYYGLGPIRGINLTRGLRLRMEFVKILEWFFGLRIFKVGNHELDEPVIHVINHRSYIDPAPLHKYVSSVYVAKSEVSSWPLIGYAASMTGILWVTRESRESRRQTRVNIKNILDQGYNVAIFPEGTTSDLPGTLPFKKGVFEIAARDNIPIVPVAVEFENENAYYVTDIPFVWHFIKAFSNWTLNCHVSIGPTLRSDNFEDLISQAQGWINRELEIIREERFLEK